jgi:hypothetical protein
VRTAHAGAQTSATHSATEVSATHAATEVSATHAATEVSATHAATEVSATHAATEVSAAHAATAMTTATATATPTPRQRGGRDAGTSHGYGYSDHRDFVQRKFPHDNFPFRSDDSAFAPTPSASRRRAMSLIQPIDCHGKRLLDLVTAFSCLRGSATPIRRKRRGLARADRRSIYASVEQSQQYRLSRLNCPALECFPGDSVTS